MVYVSESLCTGCGECVDVCPSGALRLVDGLAHIDQDLCRMCDACLTACPHGALLAIDEPARVKQPIVTREPAPLSEPRLSRSGLLPAIGAALAFVAQEIIPRAAGALLDAWDQRQARRNSVSSSWQVAADAGYSRRGGLRRRWRGGQ
jgi:Fe-S-cluster-containing hydrogenase component 2